MHIRQAEIPAAVPIRQLGMVESHEMQNRRVQVMHIHPILNGMYADIISGSVSQPPFDPTPGHPDRKSGVVVIAPFGPLSRRGPTKFSTPENQGFFKHSAGLQVL